jgi:hypothetical protein
MEIPVSIYRDILCNSGIATRPDMYGKESAIKKIRNEIIKDEIIYHINGLKEIYGIVTLNAAIDSIYSTKDPLRYMIYSNFLNYINAPNTIGNKTLYELYEENSTLITKETIIKNIYFGIADDDETPDRNSILKISKFGYIYLTTSDILRANKNIGLMLIKNKTKRVIEMKSLLKVTARVVTWVKYYNSGFNSSISDLREQEYDSKNETITTLVKTISDEINISKTRIDAIHKIFIKNIMDYMDVLPSIIHQKDFNIEVDSDNEDVCFCGLPMESGETRTCVRCNNIMHTECLITWGGACPFCRNPI